MTILSEIFAHKRIEVEAQKQSIPLDILLRQTDAVRPPLDFVAALRRSERTALIAEVKKGSPSKGVMVKDFDPVKLAKTYATNGAAAISVLTDEKYFGGSLDDLRQIAAVNLGLPLLRKEFIFDPYQIHETRAAGADAVLLIVAQLSDHQLRVLQALIRRLGMAALVEVHTRLELIRALSCGATLIGINNRNLHDFSVNLDTTRRLRALIPSNLTVVAESGISTANDIDGLGVEAVLVGEAIVRAPDVGAKVRELAAVNHREPIAVSTY